MLCAPFVLALLGTAPSQVEAQRRWRRQDFGIPRGSSQPAVERWLQWNGGSGSNTEALLGHNMCRAKVGALQLVRPVFSSARCARNGAAQSCSLLTRYSWCPCVATAALRDANRTGAAQTARARTRLHAVSRRSSTYLCLLRPMLIMPSCQTSAILRRCCLPAGLPAPPGLACSGLNHAAPTGSQGGRFRMHSVWQRRSQVW